MLLIIYIALIVVCSVRTGIKRFGKIILALLIAFGAVFIKWVLLDYFIPLFVQNGTQVVSIIVGVMTSVIMPTVMYFFTFKIIMKLLNVDAKAPVWIYVIMAMSILIASIMSTVDLIRLSKVLDTFQANMSFSDLLNAMTLKPLFSYPIKVLSILPAITLVVYGCVKNRNETDVNNENDVEKSDV